MQIRTALPSLEGATLAHAMRELLMGLGRAFAHGLAVHPLPPLYVSGVRYAPEPNAGDGWEEWADPWTVHRRGWGDCDDLVAWRLAELLAAGEAATVQVVGTGDGHRWGPRFHVRVRRADGTLEDPSIQLMGD